MTIGPAPFFMIPTTPCPPTSVVTSKPKARIRPAILAEVFFSCFDSSGSWWSSMYSASRPAYIASISVLMDDARSGPDAACAERAAEQRKAIESWRSINLLGGSGVYAWTERPAGNEARPPASLNSRQQRIGHAVQVRQTAKS